MRANPYPFQMHPADKVYYMVHSIYQRERDRAAAIYVVGKLASPTTKPDIEVRYTL